MSYVTERRRQNPGTMAAALALNGAVIIAVAMSPLVVNPPEDGHRTNVFPTRPDDPPPKQVPEDKNEARPLPPVYVPPSPVDYPPVEDPPFTSTEPVENTGGAMDGGGKGDGAEMIPDIIETPPPKFTGAQRDPRYASAFQPDYPTGLLQKEIEGSATIRVLVGTDGRVREAIVVRATHPDFGKAAVRQALKAWRFKPAMRGDVAVEDWQTLPVTFIIN